MIYLKTYLAMLAAFILLDGLWLGVVAKNVYKHYLGHLMTDAVVWGAAAAFYAMYLAGLLYFAVMPSVSVKGALLAGALLGGLCYATYDFTNWATLKAWPWQIVAIDVLWGMVLTGSVAAVGYAVYATLS